jgi:hypothetical protein
MGAGGGEGGEGEEGGEQAAHVGLCLGEVNE